MDVGIIFAAFSASIIGQLGDTYTTQIGLRGGLKEGNGIATWLTNKIGQTGLTLLKVIGAAQVLPLAVYMLSGNNETYLTVTAGIIGAEGLVATLLNYLKIKKAGIKF